jgi:hypothetical protein
LPLLSISFGNYLLNFLARRTALAACTL